MIIRDILHTKSDKIFSIAPDELVSAAVALMMELGIGSLVVKSQDNMVGLVTERDLVRGLQARGCDLARAKVSELMVTDPIIGNPEDSVDYVRGIMTENRVSHLPVMENEKLLGIISFHDVAKACLSDAQYENKLLKRYIKHWPE